MATLIRLVSLSMHLHLCCLESLALLQVWLCSRTSKSLSLGDVLALIITTGVYLTRGPSGLDPRLSGPRVGRSGFEAVRPEPWLPCIYMRRRSSSRWRPLHQIIRPRGLAGRPPPGTKPTSLSQWRSHSPL
jgi:hypothetical protein